MKVVLIGFDAATPELVQRFVAEGEMPHLQRLMERGVFAENCLGSFPSLTPPNWTTIMTGADPGTHGITDFFVHLPGEPLDKLYPGFQSELRQAETIFETLERAGGRSIIMNYPCTWPPTVRETQQLAGSFLEVASPPLYLPAVFATADAVEQKTFTMFVRSQTIHFHPAPAWPGAPESKSPFMEAEAVLDNDPVRNLMEAVPMFAPLGEGLMEEKRTLRLLAYDPEGAGYTRVIVSWERDAGGALADLGAGEWSEPLRASFIGPHGETEGEFELCLTELAPDLSHVTMLLPGIHHLELPAHPAGLDRELIERFGIPPHLLGPTVVGDAAFRRQARRQHRWLSDAAGYLMNRAPWDLFMMHAHASDFIQHDVLKMADPATAADPEEARRALDWIRFVYSDLDAMLGRIVEHAGDDAVYIVLSDHGSTAQPYYHDLGKPYGIWGGPLEAAGLTAYHEPAGSPVRHVDWSRTQAIFQRTCHVYVNLRGRDPEGIVEPGAEYEELRDRVIDTLLSYRDPATGRRPVTVALRREDARMLGLYGDRVGDVIYATADDFGGVEHAFQLPTSKFGISSMQPILVMAGPGVRGGERLGRTIELKDVAPTIAHLLGIPAPRDCLGGVIYQALK
ncbi:MAG: alkaline phosphatase family protein [Candidatus Geothermincolia bacterium]